MGDAVFTGPVTVLFTDVEGSTELHTRMGDTVAREILRNHEHLVRDQVDRHGGREVKALGDGFMVAFSSTRAALACAVAIQTAMDTAMEADTERAPGPPIRVRMGLNAGEVTEENKDLFGAAVAAAARIAGQATGGEILVADVVRQLAGKVPGLRSSNRGSFSLKGFPEPFTLHEVLWRPREPSLRLLGPLEVVAGENPLDLGGTKPRALLAILALRLNQTVPSDSLIEGLWGERAPSSATGTLHSYVSRLRKVLEDAAPPGMLPQLMTRPGGYSLVGDGDELDVARFERLVEQARNEARDKPSEATPLLRRDLALWRGPALGEFAEWAFAQTEAIRLEELRLAVTEELFETELTLGHHAEVVARLEPLVVAHPLRERFWAQLMVALYRSGRQAEALRAYQRARQTLVEELGIEPGPVLRRLEEQILAQSPELELTAVPRPAPSLDVAGRRPPTPVALGERVAADGALVGREAELDVLHQALEDAGIGRGGLVLVAGEAGMGKSALVREFSAQARARRATVCLGRAWEEEGAPPFWPWVEVVRSLLDGGHGADKAAADLTELLPLAAAPAGSSSAGLDPAQARFRLFEAAASCLVDASGTETVLAVLEDLHGADAPSLALLQFMARRLADSRVLLVGTHRPLTTPGTPAAKVLPELAREPVTRRLVLKPLEDSEVGRFLETALGTAVGSGVVASVQRWAEGHPFFLTELVHLLRSRGRGDDPGALAAEHLEIPQGISDMISRRLSTLSDNSTRVLAAASVIGRDFDLSLLERVAPLTVDEVLDALEEAERSRVIEELPGRGIAYRFGHALIREALYEGQSTARRVRLHQRIAEMIESGAAGPSEERASELAYHRCASVTEGGADEAVAAATQAARRAAAHLAYEEAARLYRLAIDTLERYGGEPGAHGRLLLGLGDAQQRAGEVPLARESFFRVATLARSRNDPELLAEAALGFGGAFEVRMFDAELVGVLEEALAALPPDARALRARLLARLAMALYFQDPLGRRVDLSGEAVDVARASGDTDVLAYALSARFFALWGPEHGDERQVVATETLALAETLGDRDLALDGLTWAIMEALEAGDRQVVDGHMARHARLAAEQRHPLHRHYAEKWQAMIAALEGRFAEAEEGAHRAYALGQQLTELAYPRRTVLLWTVFREDGRAEELADDVERIVARYPLFAVWRAGHALLRLDLGDPAPARQLLAGEMANPAEAVPRDANWLIGMVFLTEICATLGDARYASTLYELLLPHAGRCALVRFGAACWGAVSRYLGLLASTFGDWDAAAGHFEDALALNARLGARPYVAKTEHELARVLHRRGEGSDGERAVELLHSALAGAQALGMTRLAEEVRGLHPACKEISRGGAQAPS